MPHSTENASSPNDAMAWVPQLKAGQTSTAVELGDPPDLRNLRQRKKEANLDSARAPATQDLFYLFYPDLTPNYTRPPCSCEIARQKRANAHNILNKHRAKRGCYCDFERFIIRIGYKRKSHVQGLSRTG
ncbi:hypothetical protein LTR66_005732 [Elasticomyces elasticus]|nr:hypothetical protein LTR66_005732 [Elasticomyces elasticus]KAK5007226.1 hypothetical protein LTR28_005539 [Elasticomyces elasticus]